jgi:hypothetical protein
MIKAVSTDLNDGSGDGCACPPVEFRCLNLRCNRMTFELPVAISSLYST